MASETNFTPGPWVVEDDSPVTPWVRCPDDKSTLSVSRPYRERLANAYMIAAAPDLYAVVEELEESSSYWSEYFVPIGIVDRLRAALAKARGEA